MLAVVAVAAAVVTVAVVVAAVTAAAVAVAAAIVIAVAGTSITEVAAVAAASHSRRAPLDNRMVKRPDHMVVESIVVPETAAVAEIRDTADAAVAKQMGVAAADNMDVRMALLMAVAPAE